MNLLLVSVALFGLVRGGSPTGPPILPELSPTPGWSLARDASQLLGMPEVRDDLKLSPAARKALDEVSDAYDRKLARLAETRPAEEALDKLQADGADAALATLSAAQRDRLDQLGLQAMGLDGLGLAEVRKRLALSGDQAATWTARLDAVAREQAAYDEDLGAKLAGLPNPAENASAQALKARQDAQAKAIAEFEPRRKSLREARAAAYAALVGGLDPKQAETLKRMLGEPIQAKA